VTPEVRYATSRDGTRIAWKSKGEGPALIFVPPWPFAMEAFSPWPAIVESRFPGRIIYFDRRGFGLSQWHVEHGVERYADDLEAVADAAGLDNIWIYAVGAGCAESVALGARTPRVTRILAGEPVLSGKEWWERPSSQAIYSLLDKDIETFWRVFAQYAAGWGRPPARVAGEPGKGGLASATNIEAIRGMLRAYADCELHEVAPLVSAECLVVHNRGSSMFVHPHAVELARLLRRGSLLNFSSPEPIGADAETAARVEQFLHPNAESWRGAASATGADRQRWLSPREQEVLKLIAAGRTNREIAEALVLTPGTVARHVHNILTKLGAANRAAAASWAATHGIEAAAGEG